MSICLVSGHISPFVCLALVLLFAGLIPAICSSVSSDSGSGKKRQILFIHGIQKHNYAYWLLNRYMQATVLEGDISNSGVVYKEHSTIV